VSESPSRKPGARSRKPTQASRNPPLIEFDFRLRSHWKEWTSNVSRLLGIGGNKPRSAANRKAGAGNAGGRLAARPRARSAWNPSTLEGSGLLAGGLGVAIVAQILLNSKSLLLGALCYVLAAGLTIAWAIRHGKSAHKVGEPGQLSRTIEIVLVVFIMGLAIVSRFYNVGNFPYGVNGDEAAWGLQAFYSTILHADTGNFSHHFAHQPVSFYLIGATMRLFGISMITPRYLMAFQSCLSILAFYFLIRRVLGVPTALTSALLYTVSFAALSAGRKALHDMHAEIWAVLTLLTLVAAIDKRSLWLMLLAGVSLALGSLSFETFYPIIGVVILYLVVFILRTRKDWRGALRFSAVLLIPFVFVVPTVIKYVQYRSSYHLQYVNSAIEQARAPIVDLIPLLITNFRDTLASIFVALRYPDALLHWGGPIVNPWILPFFVLGLALALARIRQGHFALLVLWFVIGFFAFGTLGAGYPRVLYVGVMAIYALAGLGMMAALQLLRLLFQQDNQGTHPATVVVFTAALILVALVDLNVFTKQLGDQLGDQKRRELVDLTVASMKASPTTYLPFIAVDPIDLEKRHFEMAAYGTFDSKAPADVYQVMPFGNLLAAMGSDQTRFGEARIIFDKAGDASTDLRAAYLDAVLRCYPDHRQLPARFFDIYVISDMAEPLCYSIKEPAMQNPAAGQRVAADSPIDFQWNTPAPIKSSRLLVESKNAGVLWIEAESMAGDGWYVDSKYTSGFSGTGFLMDESNAGTALSKVTLSDAGTYRLWVRTFRRRINDQLNYISVDDRIPVEIATGGQPSIDTWYWEAVGDFSLEAGEHQIALSRTYGTDPQYSVFVDAIALSRELAYTPEGGTTWLPTYDSGMQFGSAMRHLLSAGLPPGTYRWQLKLLDGSRLLGPDGRIGYESQPVEFTVVP
jgi:hypothetical protein